MAKNRLKEKIQIVKDEIEENNKFYNKAKSGGGQFIWAILGVIGLFLWIIPGLICFIIGAIQYNNNKNLMYKTSTKISELKRELSDLEDQLEKSDKT